MWPDLKTDILGQYALVTVNRGVYSDLVVFKTAYWFTDRFYIYLDTPSPEQLHIELRCKDENPSLSLEVNLAEFCNALIDFRVREIVLNETGAIREALVVKAFTEGVPKTTSEATSANKESCDIDT